jgi:hypothetical protein
MRARPAGFDGIGTFRTRVFVWNTYNVVDAAARAVSECGNASRHGVVIREGG